jgi:sRNA-binding protein
MAKGYQLMPNRKARIEQTIVELVAAFPLAFSTEPERIRPLGVGIKQRIYERCTLSHRDIGAALRCYTGRVAYLYAIVEGAARIDLDGTPNGTVAAKEAAHDQENLRQSGRQAEGQDQAEWADNDPSAPVCRAGNCTFYREADSRCAALRASFVTGEGGESR